MVVGGKKVKSRFIVAISHLWLEDRLTYGTDSDPPCSNWPPFPTFFFLDTTPFQTHPRRQAVWQVRAPRFFVHSSFLWRMTRPVVSKSLNEWGEAFV